jgi:hypothetical protein
MTEKYRKIRVEVAHRFVFLVPATDDVERDRARADEEALNLTGIRHNDAELEFTWNDSSVVENKVLSEYE